MVAYESILSTALKKLFISVHYAISLHEEQIGVGRWVVSTVFLWCIETNTGGKAEAERHERIEGSLWVGHE